MSRSPQQIVSGIEQVARRRYPDKSVSTAAVTACDPLLLAAYDMGRSVRVRVTNQKYGNTRTGWVACTGGWQPSLMLMCRVNSSGSSDLLGPDDKVVAVKRGDKYVPVSGGRLPTSSR